MVPMAHLGVQPFLEGSCSGQGSKGECRFFCDCVACCDESKKFSKAWSTHRIKLNEKKVKESVAQESVNVVSDVSCFSKFSDLKAPTGFCEGSVCNNSDSLVSQFCG